MSEDVTKKRGRGDGEQQGFSLVTVEGEPGSRKQLKLQVSTTAECGKRV
jgi:hypothetical protein